MELLNICIITGYKNITSYSLSEDNNYYGAYIYLNISKTIGDEKSVAIANGMNASQFRDIRYGIN